MAAPIFSGEKGLAGGFMETCLLVEVKFECQF